MSQALPLRRATLQDAAAIRALVRAAYQKWVAVLGREPLPMTADYALAVREHLVWVLEDEQGLVAVLELIPLVDAVMLENIAVRPAQQGGGLGARLLRFAMDQARALRARELRLYTNQRMTSNLDWYARMGFRETHREALAGSDTARVFMSQRLEV